jgi:hypothetical protein
MIESLGAILDNNISLDNLPTHVIATKVSYTIYLSGEY